ncbi:hypothetical protein AX15_000246 [Amanita polypyramis BW_CC]|nr:hypothetical protein AX15_000246 [Amanita polypyramis BW_CC]
MSFDQTFTSATLDVAVPDTSLDIPSQETIDDWLARVRTGSVDRKQAFFDEQLRAFLIVRIKQPAPEDDAPPQPLLSLLAHLQVSFEATYISPVPDTPQDPRITNLSTPPKSSSLSKGNPRLSLHPSIFPPNTPNPTPSTSEYDRKYLTSEGTLLLASIWGQTSSKDAKEGFTLVWSPEEQVWAAIYSFSLTVSFLRLNVPDPLLCLTVSTTLRDKPITTASSEHPLALYFAKVGSRSSLNEPDPPTPVNGGPQENPTEPGFHGFEEVNLLQGLHGGPTFGTGTSKVTLPSTRLGTVSRQKLFSLPPINLPTPEPPEPSPMTALRTAHPTLRKSFRKTLNTVSGFRVRMRTVFIPYVLLPRRASSTFDDGEDERDKREAGNEERTVVLCIEIENSGESGPDVGFEVEKVVVNVGGEDTEARLIGWGEASLKNMDESKIFPLYIDSCAQYNILYAVWFLHPPDELSGPLLNRGQSSSGPSAALQRAVAIYVHGKPYEKQSSESRNNKADSPLYPTQTFSSRWNCVLDLGVRETQNPEPVDIVDPSSPTNKYPNALPEPGSPFPLSGARAGGLFSPNSSYQPSPVSHGPITTQGAGTVGPTIETRRERGSALGLPSAGLPMTPNVTGKLSAQQTTSAKVLQKLGNGESIVVSVRLMSLRDKEDLGDVDEQIYPLSRFTVEAFVFNRSTWTRRFELSYPNTAKQRRRESVLLQHGRYGYDVTEEGVNKLGHPGILPIDNRVRIGPLLPSACQTVRMQFLAVTPGVHSIDALTLTDIESGYSINLRSVMDVVVHEPT